MSRRSTHRTSSSTARIIDSTVEYDAQVKCRDCYTMIMIDPDTDNVTVPWRTCPECIRRANLPRAQRRAAQRQLASVITTRTAASSRRTVAELKAKYGRTLQDRQRYRGQLWRRQCRCNKHSTKCGTAVLRSPTWVEKKREGARGCRAVATSRYAVNESCAAWSSLESMLKRTQEWPDVRRKPV
jgi:hypothetical protein